MLKGLFITLACLVGVFLTWLLISGAEKLHMSGAVGNSAAAPERDPGLGQDGERWLLHGYIKDYFDQGIVEAQLEVLQGGKVVARTVTDDAGAFAIIISGSEPIELRTSGVKAQVSSVIIEKPTKKPVEIWTVAYGQLALSWTQPAKVFDKVTLAGLGNKQVIEKVESGFVLEKLPAGSYWVWGEGPGIATKPVVVVVRQGTTQLELQIEPGHRLTGQVLTPEGIGQKAYVDISASGSDWRTHFETADDGSFSLVLVKGRYSLTPSAQGFAGGETVVVNLPTGAQPKLYLLAGGRILGEVVDDDGVPLANVRVRVKGKAGQQDIVAAGQLGVMAGPVPPITVGLRQDVFLAKIPDGGMPVVGAIGAIDLVTEEDGRFRLRGLLPGEHTIVFEHDDFVPLEKVVKTGDGEQDLGKVALDKGTVITARIVDESLNPVPGATVYIEDTTIRRITNPQGHVPLGRHNKGLTIGVSVDGFAEATKRVTPKGDESTVEIRLTPADETLRGRVVDSNRQVVMGATVSIGGKTATTDVNGWFEIDGLPLGKHKVSLRHPDFIDTTQSLTTEREAEVTMALGMYVDCLVIRGQDDVGITGAVIRREDVKVSTDARGRALVGPLAPGRHKIVISSTGFSSETIELAVKQATSRKQVSSAQCRAALQRPGTVKGVVRDDNGNRMRGVKVSVGKVSTISDVDGRFKLQLPPGDGVLMVSSSKGYRGQVEYSVEEGQDVDLGNVEISQADDSAR